MNNKQLQNEIENILNTSKIGGLSNANKNTLKRRYRVFYNDGHTLDNKKKKKKKKIAEFKDNPKAHVLIGYDETNNRSFLEIDANVEILKDQETIDWIWNKQDKSFFDSKDDPNLCVIKVIPKSIKIMNDKKLDAPQTITFD